MDAPSAQPILQRCAYFNHPDRRNRSPRLPLNSDAAKPDNPHLECRGPLMAKIIAFFYGLAAYLVFLFAFLCAIGFVTGLVVPKTIDGGTVTGLGYSLVVNILLLSLFAVQHSVMARKSF